VTLRHVLDHNRQHVGTMGCLPMGPCFFFKVAFSEQAAEGEAARVLLVAFVTNTGCVR
jgi:hypothetical protein